MALTSAEFVEGADCRSKPVFSALSGFSGSAIPGVAAGCGVLGGVVVVETYSSG